MASELIDKQIENLIRRLGLLKMQGELDGKFHNWEIVKIIEALQAMEDLETVVNSKRQLDVLLSSTGGVLAIVQKHATHHRFVSVYGDTIPAALRAAAEAIQKGGV